MKFTFNSEPLKKDFVHKVLAQQKKVSEYLNYLMRFDIKKVNKTFNKTINQ